MQEDVRLVVVDDDHDFRLLLVTLLSATPGVEVVGDAADGFEALEVIERTDPDAAIVDLLMPGMDGFELIGRLREERPGMRLVANSAIATTERSNEVARLGVPVLSKSSNPDVLMAALRDGVAG